MAEQKQRPSAREELISIQSEMVEQARQQIYESVGYPSAVMQAYRRRYDSCLGQEFRPVEMQQLQQDLLTCQVVFFGDYHTLRESQKAPLRILQKIVDANSRPLILATELVHVVQQDILQAYLDDEMGEDEFLLAIDYEQRWGFPWANYRLQFEFARAHNITLLAINSDPPQSEDRLQIRDSIAASVIVEAMNRCPEALVAVLIGDLHLAPEHLPAQVQLHWQQWQRNKAEVAIGRLITVFQNSEEVYWQLASNRLEHSTVAVQFSDQSYCLVNSTPLMKFQSYLNWEMHQDELEESVGLQEVPQLCSTVMTDQVMEIVETVARFLEIPLKGLDRFEVHTSRDLDFLERLEQSGHYSEQDLLELREQIAHNESYFLPLDRIIYLSNLSIDHAAEEAVHYINTELGGHVQFAPTPRFDFYYRCLKEAIGFLGSRIINHKRSCFKREDFEQALAEFSGRRLRGRIRIVRDVFRDTLDHLDFELRWLEGEIKGGPRFKKLYQREVQVHVGIAHCLGYRLGDLMYDALLAGKVSRASVRALFYQRFESPESPQRLYFEWLALLTDNSRVQ